MGTNCSKDFPNPDTSNICSPDPIGSSGNDHKIPHFCTLSGSGGNSKRSQYCARLGENEWDVKEQGHVGSCSYNDCNEVQSVDEGCCNGCCGISGATVICKRTAYNGNHTNCCLQDYDFPADLGNTSQQLPLCFDRGPDGTDNSMKLTCDPEFRNITSSQCQGNLLEYCTGNDLPPEDVSWLNRWNDTTSRGNCSYAVSRNLYVDPLPLFDNIIQWPPSAYRDNQGFAWSRELMANVFRKYQAQGFRIGTLPGLPGYNSFQDNILKPICTTAPGICQQGLNTTCSNTTTDELLRNPGMVPWCGCYMPNDQYEKYVNLYQVDKECTPICARQGNIPVISADGRQTVLCNQNVCIIDDVTISLENTNVGGSINFSQFCGGCSGPVSGINVSANSDNGTSTNNGMTMNGVTTTTTGTTTMDNGSQTASSCLCIISDATINAASSSIGGGINLSEDCGTSSQCFKQNPNPGNGQPDQLPIDCAGSEDQDPFATSMQQQEQDKSERNFRNAIIIAIVIIAIFVIILFMLYLSRLGNNTEKKVIPRIKSKPVQRPNPARVAEFNRARSMGSFANNVGIYQPRGFINGLPLAAKPTPLDHGRYINGSSNNLKPTPMNRPTMSIYDRGY